MTILFQQHAWFLKSKFQSSINLQRVVFELVLNIKYILSYFYYANSSSPVTDIFPHIKLTEETYELCVLWPVTCKVPWLTTMLSPLSSSVRGPHFSNSIRCQSTLCGCQSYLLQVKECLSSSHSLRISIQKLKKPKLPKMLIVMIFFLVFFK